MEDSKKAAELSDQQIRDIAKDYGWNMEVGELYFPDDALLDFARAIAALSAQSAEIARLIADRDHWKANHDQMVARKALLEQRPDLPVDRIPAYKEMEQLQRELEKAHSLNHRALEYLEWRDEKMGGMHADTLPGKFLADLRAARKQPETHGGVNDKS